jgi:DNA-binding MarR family transcriptional regulator
VAPPERPVELTDGEQRAWVALLGVLIWLPPALDDELHRTSGTSHVEYQVLWWLSVAEGQRLHMSTLAASSNVSPSHLSRIARRLEERSWIRRAPDPDDGRYTLAHLTAEGARHVAECAPHYTAALRKLVLAELDADLVGQLENVSRGVLAAVHPDCTNPVPMALDPAPGPAPG